MYLEITRYDLSYASLAYASLASLASIVFYHDLLGNRIVINSYPVHLHS